MPQPIKIIAFDPGEVTGFVLYWSLPTGNSFEAFEKPWLDAVQFIHTYAIQYDRIVGERYDQPGKRGSVLTAQPGALMCIGALQYVASQCNVTFGLQGRSDATKAISDKTLKKLCWWTNTKDGHANAAARQLAYSLLVHHPVEYLALLESS